jgi:hypothetical protein
MIGKHPTFRNFNSTNRPDLITGTKSMILPDSLPNFSVSTIDYYVGNSKTILFACNAYAPRNRLFETDISSGLRRFSRKDLAAE